MKTTLRFEDLNIQSSWHSMLDQHIEQWHRLTTVAATDVVVDRPLNGRSGYRVRICLTVSHGTLRAEASARAFKSALTEASREVKRQIQDLQTLRLERRAKERRVNFGAEAPRLSQ